MPSFLFMPNTSVIKWIQFWLPIVQYTYIRVHTRQSRMYVAHKSVFLLNYLNYNFCCCLITKQRIVRFLNVFYRTNFNSFTASAYSVRTSRHKHFIACHYFQSPTRRNVYTCTLCRTCPLRRCCCCYQSLLFSLRDWLRQFTRGTYVFSSPFNSRGELDRIIFARVYNANLSVGNRT